MQAQLLPIQAVFEQVFPNEEAQPAKQNQHDDNPVDKRIADKGFQRRELSRYRSHQVKARVAECGNRMKHAVPDALRPAEHRHKPKAQQHRAAALDDRRSPHRKAHQPNDGRQPGNDATLLLKQRPLAQTDSLAQCHGNQCHQRHHAQAADLNRHNQHDLSEERQCVPVSTRA